MLCCGCKKQPQHVGARTKLLDPSVSNNFLYQQHQLNQANQAAALAAAAGQMQGTAMMTPMMMAQMAVPNAQTIIATQAPTPGVLGHLPGNQRFVGGVVNYMVAGQQPGQPQQQQQGLQSYGMQTVPGPGGRAQYAALAASNTAIFTKQPGGGGGGGMYSSMIFNQQQQQQQQLQHQQQQMQNQGGVDGRPQSRVVHDLVALGPDSFRRVSGIAPDVFRQIEAVEAEFDPSTLAAQYAEMERRGEMIIRILNPASLNPAWLEDTCRRYSDGLRLPSWVQFVEVIKRPGQTLGLYIRDGNDPLYPEGVYINRIALESPVYQSGCLRVGDEILAINMVDVQRMSLDDVVIIMSIPRRLILTIRSRPLNSTVDHMLPGANRVYGAAGAAQGSEGYYDTVASDIYSRVDDALGGRGGGRSSKPVVVLKQSLEDEEVAAAAEEAEAEAEAAAAAVAAALDAATVAAEVGLLDAAEIAAASAEQLQASAIRARSSSLQRLDLLGGHLPERPSSRMALAQRHHRSHQQQQQQRMFNTTSDSLSEMAADAYGYASRRGIGGRPGSALGGYSSSMDRPSSRLSLAGRNAALMQRAKGGGPGSQLYAGRLVPGGGGSRARSATGRLLRTSSDLYLAQGPEEMMDRALIQSAIAGSAARRHSLTASSPSSGDAQMDYFLQRYNAVRANIRSQRSGQQGPHFHSLDRSSGGYKSAMRNSFSNQTLTGVGGGGSSSALAQRRLQSILASRGGSGRSSALGVGGPYDLAYSDTEAYETPSSLGSGSFGRRAVTPSSQMMGLDPRVGGTSSSYASRSSSLPRGSAGPGGGHHSRMGGSSRTDALNERLAQLEQFYAMTEAAKRQTLTGAGPGGQGPRSSSSRPQSALGVGAQQYPQERDQLDHLGLERLDARREQMMRASGLQRNQSSSSASGRPNLLPALPSAAAAARKSSGRGGSGSSSYHSSEAQKQSAYEAAYGSSASSSARGGGLPYHGGLGFGDDPQRTKEINAELNAVFMSKQMGGEAAHSRTAAAAAAADHADRLRSAGTSSFKDLIPSSSSGQPQQPPRPLMIDPSGFQQYGPELRTAHGRSESTGEQAGYSGLLVIHLLGVRGLAVEGTATSSGGAAGAPSSSSSTGNALERNLYCVVECDRVYKARTVAVQAQESNLANYDWDEVFDIDLFDTKEVTFLFYTWNASARHRLCSKGVVHLPWISTLRTQHVHAFEMRLYETPGAMLYIKLEFHDLRRTFTRLRRDPKMAITSAGGKGISSSSSGKQETPLFGVDLETVIGREASGFSVPLLVKRCTEEIEARGLHLVGIYRLCGSAIRKRDLREKFERNSWLADVGADTVPDINVITSLLKDYLRELPEPLFNKALFDMMDDGLSVCLPDDPTGNAKLMFSILECLDKASRNTVLFLMDHIKLIHLNADRNKMTSQALAICFGPLFSCHADSESVHKAIQVFKFLLDIWPQRRGSFNFMRKLDDPSSKTTTTTSTLLADHHLPHHRRLMMSSGMGTGGVGVDLPTPPAVTMVRASGPVAPSLYTASLASAAAAPATSVTSTSSSLSSSSYLHHQHHQSPSSSISRGATMGSGGSGGISTSGVGGASDLSHYSSASASSSSLGSGVTTISLAGGKAGPITISERNPFRGLVGSMNAAAAAADAEYYSATKSSGYTPSSSSLFGNIDSPSGSQRGGYGGGKTSAGGGAVTSSTSWISSSSGSSSGAAAAGRQLPSTQSATRTISTYSASANTVVSQVKVPAGSTGPTPRTTSDYSSSRYGSSSSTTGTDYGLGSSSVIPTTTSSLSSSYHSTGAATYGSSDPLSSTSRLNHSAYDSTATMTTSSSYSSSSRPYYSSYLNSTTTTSSSGIGTSSYSTSSSSGLPLAERSVSPSRRTTLSSSYLTSSSSTAYSTTGSGLDPIYSTVNKSSISSGTGRTTDLFPSGSTAVYSRSSTGGGLLDDDDDLPLSYRSSSSTYGGGGVGSGVTTTTTTSSYSSYSTTTDTTSGIGSGSRQYGSSGVGVGTGRSSYLSDYSSTSSPPTGGGVLGESSTGGDSSSSYGKPLIGSATQLVYPSKFSGTSSAINSNGATTGSSPSSSSAYRSSYGNI